MFSTDLGNLQGVPYHIRYDMGRSVYNRNIFRTSLYIYIVQDEKCRLMRNLSLSMMIPFGKRYRIYLYFSI